MADIFPPHYIQEHNPVKQLLTDLVQEEEPSQQAQLTRKQKREKNLEREQSKVIQKQSIRVKKS